MDNRVMDMDIMTDVMIDVIAETETETWAEEAEAGAGETALMNDVMVVEMVVEIQ